jgi:alpha-L-fucosidase
MHGQVEELCTNYGKIDIFWFDFSYGEMTGEKWKATQLVRMIRQYHPDVLIDNRLEVSGVGFGSLLSGAPSEYSGDFVSPEQLIPPEGIMDVNGKPVVWEACVTMNNSWGYHRTDRNFKPAGMIIKKLVECVSKGGNLLLNVGPDAKGVIPRESLDILREIGVWMRQNGESVYGCGHAGLDKPEYGRFTRRGDMLYVHIFENQVGAIPLTGLAAGQIKRMWMAATGAEISICGHWFVGNYPDIPFISLGDSPNLPDQSDTVVAVELHS